MAARHVSLDHDLNKTWHLWFKYIAKRHKASLANGSDGVLTTERQKHRQTMAKPMANDSFLLGMSAHDAWANQEKCACGSTKLRHKLQRKLSSVRGNFVDIGVRVVRQLPYYAAGGRFWAKYIGKRKYRCIGKRLHRCIGKRSKWPKLLRRKLREREQRTYTAHTACTAYTAYTACAACTAYTACTAANAWIWNGKRSNFEAANGLKLNRQTKTIFGSSISANGVKALEI